MPDTAQQQHNKARRNSMRAVALGSRRARCCRLEANVWPSSAGLPTVKLVSRLHHGVPSTALHKQWLELEFSSHGFYSNFASKASTRSHASQARITNISARPMVAGIVNRSGHAQIPASYRQNQKYWEWYIRSLTSKIPGQDDDKSESVPTTATHHSMKDTTHKPETRQRSEPLPPMMDDDFAKYLSGQKSSPVPSWTPEQAEAVVSKRKRNRLFALREDKEVYSQIRHLQRMQKEQSRLKTAANVHRALYGNVIICVAKLGAWLSSGSSSMLAEFIHSVVDCGNQGLLLLGLRDSRLAADRTHPYGYGKSIYFWALVSALGTFFLGAGVSMTHAVGDLLHPSLQTITPEVWAVLAMSFGIDGYVFFKTCSDINESKPANVSFFKHVWTVRDPATLAILLEDGAACLGVLMAFAGIAASHATGNPMFDGIAGVGISTLLGAMGIALVRVNQRFLLGQAVDKAITDDIERILLTRRSIDNIGSVQSQWTGPETFSYKAEVDFDGTYLAAKLMPIYQQEFMQIKDSMDSELQVLLALYAEDVMRTAEREVRHVESMIRKKYPGAEYIELEPMSLDADRLAIDDNLEAELRRVESDALNRYLKSLRKETGYSLQETTSDETTEASRKDATPSQTKQE